MSPDYWTSHGCSALFVSVCIFVWYMYSQFCKSLCASPASLCISCANGLSFYFESMCLLALLFVCLFVLCLFVGMCLFAFMCVYFLRPPPYWSACDAHGQSGQGYVCMSLCFCFYELSHTCVYTCLHVIPSLWWWCTWPDGPRLRESLRRWFIPLGKIGKTPRTHSHPIFLTSTPDAK